MFAYPLIIQELHSLSFYTLTQNIAPHLLRLRRLFRYLLLSSRCRLALLLQDLIPLRVQLHVVFPLDLSGQHLLRQISKLFSVLRRRPAALEWDLELVLLQLFLVLLLRLFLAQLP